MCVFNKKGYIVECFLKTAKHSSIVGSHSLTITKSYCAHL